jgi:flagellar hook-associated protein 3 FlgL
MFQRITFDMMNRDLLTSLNVSNRNEDMAMMQLETGKRVNQPSDDPAAEAAYIQNRTQASAVTQYLQTASNLSGTFQVANSALSGAVNVLTSAVSLGVEGGNGNLTSAQQQALTQSVDQMQQQLLNVSNTTFQGNYIFSGSKTKTASFVLDNTQSSGVLYQGNTETMKVAIAPNNQITTNVPGSQIFNDAFQSLSDLKNGLSSGNTSQIESAVTSLRSAIDTINQQRVTYSSGMTRLQSAQTLLQNQNLQLQSQENDLIGTDMAAAITNANTAMVARNAILSVGSRLTQVSLLNYMH